MVLSKMNELYARAIIAHQWWQFFMQTISICLEDSVNL